VIKRQIRHLKKQLEAVYSGELIPEKVGLDNEVLKGIKSKRSLRRKLSRIRFQRGQREKFYKGLLRSQLYLDRIRAKFQAAGLPEDLAYLPHVESSFDYKAYSKAGAAGIWQFIRSTGRRYLKINYAVDERRDPIASTVAAIKLLQRNYEKLKTWPLALTAYNHGARSMSRAVRVVGERDIATIIENYQNRRFGFASKNFYACFLAARDLAKDPKPFFGNIPPVEPVKFTELRLDRRYRAIEVDALLDLVDIHADRAERDRQVVVPRPVVVEPAAQLFLTHELP